MMEMLMRTVCNILSYIKCVVYYGVWCQLIYRGQHSHLIDTSNSDYKMTRSQIYFSWKFQLDFLHTSTRTIYVFFALSIKINSNYMSCYILFFIVYYSCFLSLAIYNASREASIVHFCILLNIPQIDACSVFHRLGYWVNKWTIECCNGLTLLEHTGINLNKYY